MAGHSKWAKVKHFKGAIDAKRARIFAKLSRELSILAKIGGADPGMNPRLRMVLLKCRSANMPFDNIERAIKRGAGGGDISSYEELTYEVYGPHGVAMLGEVSTDNRNRTAAELRSILAKNGGIIATSNAVTRLFHRKGQIIVARENAGEDAVMELALEAGAEDFKTDPQGYEILTDPAHFEAVLKAIDSRAIPCEAAAITFIPEITVQVRPSDAKTVSRLIEALEEHDDVKEIYTNAEFEE